MYITHCLLITYYCLDIFKFVLKYTYLIVGVNSCQFTSTVILRIIYIFFCKKSYYNCRYIFYFTYYL